MLTNSELQYLLGVATRNRDNSAALAEKPEQRWKEAHKAEVTMMDALIEKLEDMISDNTPVMTGGKKRYEIVFANSGDVFRSTINRKFFWEYVEEATQAINDGIYSPKNMYLREVRETPILRFLDRQE